MRRFEAVTHPLRGKRAVMAKFNPTCQRVLVRRHGYRIQPPTGPGPSRWREQLYGPGPQSYQRRSYATDSSLVLPSRKKQLAALSKQDPQGRIRFLPPDVSPDMVYDYYDEDEVESITAHLIPFWTVMMLYNVHTEVRVSPNGSRWDNLEPMEIGCSVSAAPKGHWAHGIALPDDFRRFNAHLTASRSNAPKEQPGDMYDGVEHLFPRGDFAVDFDTSYPELNDKQSAKVVRACSIPWLYNGDVTGRKGYVRLERHHLETPETYASPYYRLAYRIKLKGGSEAYMDGYMLPNTYIFLIKHQDGRSYMDLDRWRVPDTAEEYPSLTVVYGVEGKRTMDLVCPAFRADEIFDQLYLAAQGRKMDWQDGHIVPLATQEPILTWLFKSERTTSQVTRDADERYKVIHEITPVYSNEYMPSLAELQTEIEKRVTMRSKVPFPHIRQTAEDKAASAKHRAQKASKQPPSPQAEATPGGQSRPLLSRPDVKPATTLGSAAGTSSKAQAKARPKPLPSPPPRQSPSTANRATSPSTPSPSTSTRSPPVKPAPAPAPILDPESHYKNLGISRPTIHFIEPEYADRMDDTLRAQRNQLAKLHHPDISKADAEIFVKINAAYEAIKDLDKRLVYNNTSRLVYSNTSRQRQRR